MFAEVSQLCDGIWGFLLRKTLRMAAQMRRALTRHETDYLHAWVEAARLRETNSLSLPRSNRKAILSLTIDSAEAPSTSFDD